MDIALLFSIAVIVWFALAVINKVTNDINISGVQPNENISGIFPLTWFLPAIGYDWVVEEVIEGKEVYRGTCPGGLDGEFTYLDEKLSKQVDMVFYNGIVIVTYRSVQ